VISPLPVNLNRFLALEFVLTFGIIILLRLLPAGVPGLPGHLSGLVGNKNLEREGIEIICTCKYFN
jgi:hypothetical protein